MQPVRVAILTSLATLGVVPFASIAVRADDGSPAATGSRAYLGIRTGRLSSFGHPELPDGVGVPITFVVTDSPAEHSGLEPGDVLVAVDGRFVAADEDLESIVERLVPGERVEIQYLREGRRRRTFVEIDRQRPAERDDVAEAERARAELARAALLNQQRPKSRRDDLGLATGPVRERAVALSKKGKGPVKVVVEESGRKWSWGSNTDVPEGVPQGAVDDVERLLDGFEKQRSRNGLRLRIQPHVDGDDRSVVVLICQPDADGYRLLEVERPTNAEGAIPVDEILAGEPLRGELGRLSKPVREKLVKALRTHRPPPVQVQVRQPK